jgi:hypothetical protein
MTLQLAEGEDLYFNIPTPTGFKKLHRAAFINLTDAEFEKVLDYLEPYQMAETVGMSASPGWRAKARADRKAKKQEARQQRQQTKAEGRLSIQQAKAEGIKTGVVKTGAQIVGDVAGKYVDMLGTVVPAIAPALIPGAGAAGAAGGLLGKGVTGVIPRTEQLQPTDEMEKDDEEKTFFEKYGIWLGVGAVVLVGGYFLLKPKK